MEIICEFVETEKDIRKHISISFEKNLFNTWNNGHNEWHTFAHRLVFFTVKKTVDVNYNITFIRDCLIDSTIEI